MKKGIIIAVILLVLCCCCSIIIGSILLFTSPSGYVEFNGKCLHRGAQSNPKDGPCAQAPIDGQPAPDAPTNTPPINPAPPASNTEVYDGRNSDEYTFSYPRNFTLQDESIVYVYAQDPKGTVTGGFNDNLNITSTATSFDVNSSNCEEYATSVLAAIEGEINVNKSSVKTNQVVVNGFDACSITYDGSYLGVNLKQEQYVIPDTLLDQTFILTVSMAKNSENSGVFTQIVNSFEIY